MRRLVFSCVSTVFIVSGCSTGLNTAHHQAEASTVEIVELIRNTVSYSYIPYEDPAAMMGAVELAALGTVASVEPALIADPMEDYGAVVVGVEPSTIWKDHPPRTGELVYFYFDRPTNLDVARYREGLPVGTTVAIFGFDSSDLVRFAEGDPGATVYAPAPQGLFLCDGESRLLNVWGDGSWPRVRTVADLRTSLGE